MSLPEELALGPGREFDRIRAVRAALGAGAAGLGDDCAALADGVGTLVASVDLSIEGIHFRRDWLSSEEIGWRAAAAALSDLAAEGATAIGVLAGVAVSRSAESEVVALMRGIGDAVTAAGGRVLGGDLSVAPQWVVSITVLGRAERVVTRGGARPGDDLWVTGRLGGSRAALVALERGETPAEAHRQAFARPVPRIGAGQLLAGLGATAMIDLSDGLGGDAAHLAAASAVRLDIELADLPVAEGLAGLSDDDPAVFAARGGEDYELLVALPRAARDVAPSQLARAAGLALTRIGSVTEGQGVRLALRGREVALRGHDHFA